MAELIVGGGIRVNPIANKTMSALVLRRATKNSGLS